MKTNNYTESIKIINNSKFSIKSIKTFKGREGYGINANLYYNNKKVAFLLDSGNGGCLDIDWDYVLRRGQYISPTIVKEAELYLRNLAKSLPKTTWGELSEARGRVGIDDSMPYDWDDEAIMNVLIDYYSLIITYNKWLKKVVIFNKKTKKIERYKCPKSDLGRKFKTEKGVEVGRDFFGRIGIILNDLPKKQAFEYFDKYVA